jgi:cobalt-zinc-cadmium efflux system protein
LTPFRLLRNSGRVLLEAAPEGMNVEEIGRAIAAHLHVENVHDLHVWQISSGFPSLSAHVLVHPGDDCHGIRRELEQLLDERFAIDHTNLQVDHAPNPVSSASARRRRRGTNTDASEPSQLLASMPAAPVAPS